MASGIEGLQEFTLSLKREGEVAIPAQVGMYRDRLTLGVHRRIVFAHPVDTGYSRNNVNASVGTPDERLSAPGGESYPAPDMPTSLPTAGPFEPGYVTSAVAYEVFLNEGSSQQAPAHYWQRAIEEEIADAGA